MATPKSDGERIASSPLFKGFLRKAEDYLKQPLRIKQLLNDAYTKADAKKDIGHLAHEAWESLQTLFRLVKAAASGEYTGMPTPTVLGAVAVLIYFLSPIDIVPDFIPVVGYLDDVALMAWFTSTLKTEMDKFADWERSKPQIIVPSGERFEPAPESAKKGPVTRQLVPTVAAVASVESAGHSTGSGSFVEADESAKKAGTTDLPGGPGPAPATAAESAPEEHATPSPDQPHLLQDPAANTTDSSRESNRHDPAGGDPGGNVR